MAWADNRDYILKSLAEGTAGDRQDAFEEWKTRYEASGSPTSKEGMLSKEQYAVQSAPAAPQPTALDQFRGGVQDINEAYQQQLGQIAASGQYDRQSQILDAGSHLRVNASNEIETLMNDLGLTQDDLRQSISGSSNDLFMDLGVGNLALHDVKDIDQSTTVDVANVRDVAAQGGPVQTTSGRLGDYTIAEHVDDQNAELALSLIASAAIPGLVGPAGLGLTGIYGGAAAGAGTTLANQVIYDDYDLGEIAKSGLLGGLTAAGGDFLKDTLSGAVDPATGARATTTDFGGLIGEKGLFSSIPELDITGVRDFGAATGDFLFGPSTTQDWVQMTDGSRLVPDGDGYVTLPSGQSVSMQAIQQNPRAFSGVADTLMQKAGEGGLLAPFKPAFEAFNTAFTPIADQLATAIVGDNPWHDERLTLEERLEAPRSLDAMSQSIYRDLPSGSSGSTPMTEEEEAASQPLVVGEVIEQILEDDEDLNGTGPLLGTGDGVSQGELPSESELVAGEGETTIPTGTNSSLPTDYDTSEDLVGRTQTLPTTTQGGGGGGATLPELLSRRGAPEDDDELFRLAKILRIEGLPADLGASVMARIQSLLAGEEAGEDVKGDVTAVRDKKATTRTQREDVKDSERRTVKDIEEDAVAAAIKEAIA